MPPSKTPTVLLTGITGFLGIHVALQLLRNGYRVRGSMRDLARTAEVRDTLARHGADTEQLEFVELDLLKDEGWHQAMQGIDYLQHTASPFVLKSPRDEMELIRPAVEGTRRAISAALEAGVKHVVLTSSSAAIMYGAEPDPAKVYTQADWTNVDGPHVTPYTKSKTLAEQKAWELMEAATRRDSLSVINPTFILGPLLNTDPGTSGSVIQRFLNGSIPALPKISFPCIDVRDVAEIHLLAMTAPEARGQRLITSQGALFMSEMAQALRQAFPDYSTKVPRFDLPDWAVRLYALFDQDARAGVPELGQKPRAMDASRAERLLGRPFITARQAVVDMGRSLIEQKLV